jgi:hypothetical protein
VVQLHIYSLELQASKSAVSVIQLYILQNLRLLASHWKQCAFVLVPPPFVCGTMHKVASSIFPVHGRRKAERVRERWHRCISTVAAVFVGSLFFSQIIAFSVGGKYCPAWLCRRACTVWDFCAISSQTYMIFICREDGSCWFWTSSWSIQLHILFLEKRSLFLSL